MVSGCNLFQVDEHDVSERSVKFSLCVPESNDLINSFKSID